jgi:hypothetical protein
MQVETRAVSRTVGLSATVLMVLTSGLAAQPVAPPGPLPARWYKGQTHCHTLNSDGDSTPDEVIKWYRQQRYHFLVLSDHDVLTPVATLNEIYGAGAKVSSDPRVTSNPFLLIPGEEVTDKFSPRAAAGETRTGRDVTQKEIHLTAVNPRKAVVPQGGSSVTDTLQRDVDAIRAASGFAIVNHPLLHWSMTAADLSSLRGVKAFEVWNGGTHTNNYGGAGSPGTEALWDQVLSRGTLLYGVAADDAHEFKDPSFPMALTIPGRAWIMVRARELTAEAIVDAMDRGDFYATTGLELSDYEATPSAISIGIRLKTRFKYDVTFIGRGGRILKQVPIANVESASGVPARTAPVVYDIRGDEGYVRAKITDSNGYVAWTQPVLVPAR